MGVAKGWHKNFEDGINQGGINIIEFLVWHKKRRMPNVHDFDPMNVTIYFSQLMHDLILSSYFFGIFRINLDQKIMHI